MDNYLEEILQTNEHVYGEIYEVVNVHNGKRYIGQTLTHRLNHGKYRPYGFRRRFLSHISEAVCDTKQGQCSGLSNAIRKHGKDAFTVNLLMRCATNDLDKNEQHFIAVHNTLHPNGYNLARGGNHKHRVTPDIERVQVRQVHVKSSIQNDETKVLIGRRLREYYKKNMQEAQEAFERNKEKRLQLKLKNIPPNPDINVNQLDKYLVRRVSKGKPYFLAKVSSKLYAFQSKYDDEETSKQRAINFLKQVADDCDLQRLQIAGSP